MRNDSKMKSIQSLGRQYLFNQLPSHHKFAIRSCYPHGEAVVLNALMGVGYTWNTAKQLFLAYEEQQDSEHQA